MLVPMKIESHPQPLKMPIPFAVAPIKNELTTTSTIATDDKQLEQGFGLKLFAAGQRSSSSGSTSNVVKPKLPMGSSASSNGDNTKSPIPITVGGIQLHSIPLGVFIGTAATEATQLVAAKSKNKRKSSGLSCKDNKRKK